MNLRRCAAAGAAVVVASALAGCGGSDGPVTAEPVVAAPAVAEQTQGKRTQGKQTVVEQLQPAAFAKRIDRGDGMLINVHVPNEGEIRGTDAHIPYLSVAISEKMPADKDRELLIYCRSGHMSAEAGQSLVAAGHTHVVELAGGFNAWTESGRRLSPAPA